MAQSPSGDAALLEALANLAASQTPDEALDCTAAALDRLARGGTWLAAVCADERTQMRASRGGTVVASPDLAGGLLARAGETSGVWLRVGAREVRRWGGERAAQPLHVAAVRSGEALGGVLALGLPPGARLHAEQRSRVALLARHLGAVLGHLRLRRELQEQSTQVLAMRAQLEAYARDMRVTYEAEREHYRQLRHAYEDLIRMLAVAIEERDDYTGGHIKRVAAYAAAIGRELGLRDGDLQALEMGAVLHDIGKIGITDAILRKQGVLGPGEWAKMREHPLIGARLLESIPFLRPALDAIIAHHERVDGLGYPHGLAGEAIPLVGRIVAVADAFDAMTTDRPYRRARPSTDAMVELRHQGGRQLDRHVVAAFERVFHHGRFDGLLTEIEERASC
ncbi:MAG: HD-GYP domain-containing protein [Chloroflexi bacterium]|nr:HD-GYP domain-containing protein [Chloroflexota bacterium]